MLEGMRTKSGKAKRCPLCGLRMKKNGRTKAGAQRWKCVACDLGATHFHGPSGRAASLAVLESFVARLLGGHTLSEEGRSFQHHTAWCWNERPR